MPRAAASARIIQRAVPLISGLAPNADVYASRSITSGVGEPMTAMVSPSIRTTEAAPATSASTDSKTIIPLGKTGGSMPNARLYHRVLEVLHHGAAQCHVDELRDWQ